MRRQFLQYFLKYQQEVIRNNSITVKKIYLLILEIVDTSWPMVCIFYLIPMHCLFDPIWPTMTTKQLKPGSQKSTNSLACFSALIKEPRKRIKTKKIFLTTDDLGDSGAGIGPSTLDLGLPWLCLNGSLISGDGQSAWQKKYLWFTFMIYG